MGFMESWKNWSQNQWDKWGSKLRPTYKRIDAWKTPDWVKKAGDKIWDFIDDDTKKFLYKYIMETLKKFDGQFAEELINGMLKAVIKWFKIK